MALVVLLRGVNVGGHRTFRPSVLARELSRYDVVNVGAAGTFVVRRPGSREELRAALLRKLPVQTEIVFCEGRTLLRLEADDPFGPGPPASGVVRFVSFLMGRGGTRPSLPMLVPPDGDWFVRIVALTGGLACGEYRRHMKTIGYLGRLDKLIGVPVTTRNWNTIGTVLRVLKAEREVRS